jgi:hypothetical protein
VIYDLKTQLLSKKNFSIKLQAFFGFRRFTCEYTKTPARAIAVPASNPRQGYLYDWKGGM